MSHILTTSSESGIKATETRLQAVELAIGVTPGQPMSLRMYFADCAKETFTPNEGEPVITEKVLNRIGMLELSEESLKAVPEFLLIYSVLKRIADAAAAEAWPELVNIPVPQP